ncbi:putative Protein F12F1.11 [Melia azedarach]|uniref:Uncharacterized protein n=1 Tax=Melia azedarach TaxID=155640 RepID=A0ACC1Z370_MELAZ|nr:putative Protein F12F1.11 [Melia azedarach]
MKQLCSKGKVHPSPSPMIGDQLSFLPATILTLAAALSPEDKEVLAYLISCCGSCNNNTADSFSGPNNKTTHKSSVGFGGGAGDGDHAPVFHCNCFRCYMLFWARWDKSPNRQLIHEIIEAYEEGLFRDKRSLKKKKRGKRGSDELKNGYKYESVESKSAELSCDRAEEVGGGEEYGDKVEPEIKGSVSKIVSFLGGRIWDIWQLE